MISFNAGNINFSKSVSNITMGKIGSRAQYSLENDTYVNSATSANTPSEFGNFSKIIPLYNRITNSIEPCLLINTSSENGGCLRLIKYDPAMIKKLRTFFRNEPEIYKKYQANYFTLSESLLNEINDKSPEATETIKNLFIAEIAYSKLLHPLGLEKLKKLNYTKNNPDKDIICIQNFFVYKNEYKNASRNLIIPLFKNVLNDNPNIIIKAQAFGPNPKSPINLYLRYGFIPLDTNIEKLNQSKIKTPKGFRINPNETAIMFLPENALLYQLLAKI